MEKQQGTAINIKIKKMTEDIQLRFVVVSDGHINYDDGYEQEHNDAADTISDLHNQRNVDFVVYNGDFCQGEPAHDTVKTAFFDRLPNEIPYYASYGNHEYVDSEDWPDLYGHETWHSFTVNADNDDEYGFLIVQSATDASDGHEFNTEASCPTNINPGWIESELDTMETNGVEGVFVFCHVPPFEGYASNDCPDTMTQFERNIVDGVFCGHDHSENSLIVNNGQRYFFTCHLGGRGAGDTGVRVMDIVD